MQTPSTVINIIGIFEDFNSAEDAALYLLGNEFESEDVDLHRATDPQQVAEFFAALFDNEKEAEAHASAALNNTILTIHAPSVREAQEAADVLNNYGAIDVSLPGSEGIISRITPRPVNGIRLRDAN